MSDARVEATGGDQALAWLTPPKDLEAATQAGRRAMDSFGQVGQVLSETAQAVMKKQAQIVSGSMSRMMAEMHDLQRLHTPQEIIAAEATAFRSGMEETTNGIREISDLMRRCGYEMIELWLSGLTANGAAKESEARTARRKAQKPPSAD